jgi:hypothetical protein
MADIQGGDDLPGTGTVNPVFKEKSQEYTSQGVDGSVLVKLVHLPADVDSYSLKAAVRLTAALALQLGQCLWPMDLTKVHCMHPWMAFTSQTVALLGLRTGPARRDRDGVGRQAQTCL